MTWHRACTLASVRAVRDQPYLPSLMPFSPQSDASRNPARARPCGVTGTQRELCAGRQQWSVAAIESRHDGATQKRRLVIVDGDT